MSKPAVRIYKSAVREHQATETRRTIADAADRLLRSKGYTKMTIEAVAREAGVAPQTVYAVFGSKQGILVGLIDRVLFLEQYETIFHQALKASNPHVSLHCLVSIMRQVFVALGPVHQILRSSGLVAPELARLEKNMEQRRWDLQLEYIMYLYDGGYLRDDVDIECSRDTFWCLTGRESYRLLVEGHNWDPIKYENWLVDIIVKTLLKPKWHENV